MFVTSLLLRRGARQPPLAHLSAVSCAHVGLTASLGPITSGSSSSFSRRSAASPLIAASYTHPLLSPRRYGSAVSRASAGRSRRGKSKAAPTRSPAAAAAAVSSPSGVNSDAHSRRRGVLSESPLFDARLQEADEEEGEPALSGLEDDEGDGADTASAYVSPLAAHSRHRRRRRAAPSRSYSDDPTDAAGDGAGEEDDDELATPAEDPTAPGVDDSDEAEADGATAEMEETRVDGVEDNDSSSSSSDMADDKDEGEDLEAGGGPPSRSVAAGAAGPSSGKLATHLTPGDEEVANRFLAVAFLDLAAEYSAAGPTANAVPVEEVCVDAAEVATWRCPVCQRLWQCGVFVRCILKNGCPHCAKERSTTMASVRPDLVQLWDHSRNDPFLRPDEIEATSKESVYWNCPTCRDSYAARVRDRVTDKARCPTCALQHTSAAAALESEESALLHEWHPLKNGDLRLDQLSPTDRKTKVWWLCSSCGHEWDASLAARLSRSRRNKGRVCPACHGKGVMEVY